MCEYVSCCRCCVNDIFIVSLQVMLNCYETNENRAASFVIMLHVSDASDIRMSSVSNIIRMGQDSTLHSDPTRSI